MNVLLLTEEPGDRRAFRESLALLSSQHVLTACETIGEVWEKLTSQTMPPPNLIFLDFELSRTYNHELVNIFKGEPNLRAAPIVVYSDSPNGIDITAAYDQSVACYVVLPAEPLLRRAKVRAVLEFWSTHAQLPELCRWWPA